MCGIVGIHSQQSAAIELFESLIHLQHRGQDAAGILTCQERFYVKRGLGLVREIFNQENLSHLHGRVGMGHVRYPTAGGSTIEDVQPLWIGSPRGIALVHNGNLTNHQALADDIILNKHRHLNSTTDSEVLLHLFADGLEQAGQNFTAHSKQTDTHFFEMCCDAVKTIFSIAKGSYSVISIIIGKGMIAFRDPHGIRPLVLGKRGSDYILASETTMLYPLGFEFVDDIKPGEVIFITQDGQLFRRQVEKRNFSPCIFEYVYFARPDSTIDQVNVYRSRLRMGQNLANLWKKTYPDILPDVVIPVPFTSNTAALSFAHELGVRYSEGLYKNPFIGRTFIMGNSKERSRSVRYKLTPQKTEINKKKVLLLDDSIVRGTTSKEIVKMVREFGAKEIYLASACPPVKFPCYYGIDIPTSAELIAANYSHEQIQAYLGVDKLLYQAVEGLAEAVTRKGNHQIEKPCMACLDGCYVAS